MSSGRLEGLVLYRGLLTDKIVQYLLQKEDSAQLEYLLVEAAERLGLSGVIPVEYVLYLISHQENVFTAMAERSGLVGASLRVVVRNDILLLRKFLAALTAKYKERKIYGNYEPTLVREVRGRELLTEIFLDYEGDKTGEKAVLKLCDYYRIYGYGPLADFIAFSWDGARKELCGISNFTPLPFASIYGYNRQIKALRSNTEAFLAGRPANNVFLYGERGTGKSSSLKALGVEYYQQGLRLVEVRRQDFTDLPLVLSRLAPWGKKFIIVLDDLSFEEFEVEYKALKSALDGSLANRPRNVLYYATSNRRNIIKEVWQDQDMRELHNVDSVNEKISMVDRFGLKLYYDSLNQEDYLALLRHLAQEAALTISDEELRSEAVRWEMSHTGRNGRIARQLIDNLLGKEVK